LKISSPPDSPLKTEYALRGRSGLLPRKSLAGSLLLLILLYGCGGGGGTGGLPNGGPSPAGSVRGNAGDGATSVINSSVFGTVLGGTSPISGAKVILYQAGTSVGATPVSLGSGSTDSKGQFLISFAIHDPASILYLVATGGDAGKGPNAAIELSAMLGKANHFPSPVAINEVTSVALGYAARPMISPSSDPSVAGPTPSIEIAAATSGVLIDPAAGTVQSSLDSSVQNIINGLADILASCVQGSDSNCTALFSGSTAAEMFAGLLTIVENPSINLSAIWGLIGNNAPYSTTFLPPSSLSLALRFPGTFSFPTRLAIDGAGNIWVANPGNGSVTEVPRGITPASCAASPSACINFSAGGITAPNGMAIDAAGNVWVANVGGTVVEIPNGVTPGSCAASPSACISFEGGGVENPDGVAVDATGNIWIANFGNSSVTEIPIGATPASCAASPSACINFSGGGISGPKGISADSAGNIWIANFGNSSVTEIPVGATSASCAASPSACINFSGTAFSFPDAIASDSAGNIWVANFGNSSVTEIPVGATSASCVASPSACISFSGGDINQPYAVAADAQGTIWVANFGSSSVTEIPVGATPTSCAASPSACISFSGGGINNPYGIAPDAAGNLWISDFTDSSLTELITTAAPTKTPLLGAPGRP